ncbi:ATP-binding protein [Streptomyces gilvus]|uniref:ATP-binding protein n=1 Tax=Streptomyces gilvus TaxID=2920937 RepID=UPI001F117E30|nr:ATP-binding protein [Streptomyces sp. CME 23]MCH5671049.1 ATP-binding protein [Streptomyces sp. CME 23]
MVIPLMKQAEDEPGGNEHATLRYAAAWGPTTPRSAQARRDLRAVLAHAPSAGRAPLSASRAMDAELVVSELVTNVLRHAPGPCALTVRLTGTHLAISLYDTSPQAPTVRPPDRGRVGGHGLHLVRSVSDEVVVTPRGRGKEITAHLRLVTGDELGTADRTVLSSSLSGRTRRTS